MRDEISRMWQAELNGQRNEKGGAEDDSLTTLTWSFVCGVPLPLFRGKSPGEENGAPRGTRTHDPVIKNHLLYQLSYWRPM